MFLKKEMGWEAQSGFVTRSLLGWTYGIMEECLSSMQKAHNKEMSILKIHKK